MSVISADPKSEVSQEVAVTPSLSEVGMPSVPQKKDVMTINASALMERAEAAGPEAVDALLEDWATD